MRTFGVQVKHLLELHDYDLTFSLLFLSEDISALEAMKDSEEVQLVIKDMARTLWRGTGWIRSVAPSSDALTQCTMRVRGENYGALVTLCHQRCIANIDMMRCVDLIDIGTHEDTDHVYTTREEIMKKSYVEPPRFLNPDFMQNLRKQMEKALKENGLMAPSHVITREEMTPDTHQFYVGSPRTHNEHRWAKRTLKEAITHAEQLAIEQGKPQYVVQVVEIINPTTTRRKPRAVKEARRKPASKEVKRGKKA